MTPIEAAFLIVAIAGIWRERRERRTFDRRAANPHGRYRDVRAIGSMGRRAGEQR